MAERKRRVVEVNRAPVMTLWAAVVARRLGHGRDAALTLGRSVAGLNARSKAKAIGLAEEEDDASSAKEQRRGESIPLLGRQIPVVETPQGVRAADGGRPVSAAGVDAYLRRSFGDDLGRVEAAMERLAASRRPAELRDSAYGLYERFRPAVPPGKQGWGAKGELEVDLIESLAAATAGRSGKARR